jgi:hypothetical protein
VKNWLWLLIGAVLLPIFAVAQTPTYTGHLVDPTVTPNSCAAWNSSNQLVSVPNGLSSPGPLVTCAPTIQYKQFNTGDYGACAGGDVTTAINNTIAAANNYAAGSGLGAEVVMTPCGPTVSAALTALNPNVTFDGSGGFLYIQATDTTSNLFSTVASTFLPNVQIRNITIQPLGTMTAGILFDIHGCDGCTFSNISIAGHIWDLFDFGDNAVSTFANAILVQNVEFISGSNSGGAMLRARLGAGGIIFRDSGLIGNGTNTAFVFSDSGIGSNPNWDSFVFDTVGLEGFGAGTNITLTHSGYLANDIFEKNVVCDATATGPCLTESGTNGATIRRVKLTIPWFDTAANNHSAIEISSDSSSFVYDTQILGGNVSGGGTSGNGISIGQYVVGVQIIGTQGYGSTNAGVLDNGTNTQITGGCFGTCGYTGNKYGIQIGASSSNATVEDNTLLGNVTAPLSISGSATTPVISGNVGYQPTVNGITGSLCAWSTQAGAQVACDTSGNFSASNFYGNGSHLTGISSGGTTYSVTLTTSGSCGNNSICGLSSYTPSGIPTYAQSAHGCTHNIQTSSTGGSAGGIIIMFANNGGTTPYLDMYNATGSSINTATSYTVTGTCFP